MVFRPRGLIAIANRRSGSSCRPAAHHERLRSLIEVEHLTMRFGGLLAIDASPSAPVRARSPPSWPNGAETTVFNCITGSTNRRSALTLRATASTCWSGCWATNRPAGAGGADFPEHPLFPGMTC